MITIRCDYITRELLLSNLEFRNHLSKYFQIQVDPELKTGLYQIEDAPLAYEYSNLSPLHKISGWFYLTELLKRTA